MQIRSKLTAVLLAAIFLSTQALCEVTFDFEKLKAQAEQSSQRENKANPSYEQYTRTLDDVNTIWLTENLEYNKWVFANRRYSYIWEFASTIFIFVLVMGIIIFGMRLSYLQFRRDLYRRVKEPNVQEAAQPDSAPEKGKIMHSLKVGLQGVEISSSIVGLLILTLSLAFFYLYLKEVYPLREAALMSGQEQVNSDASVKSTKQ